MVEVTGVLGCLSCGLRIDVAAEGQTLEDLRRRIDTVPGEHARAYCGSTGNARFVVKTGGGFLLFECACGVSEVVL